MWAITLKKGLDPGVYYYFWLTMYNLPIRNYRRVLIANRGEIARAICREAKALNIETVGINSLIGDYPQEADRIIPVEASRPLDAYLQPDLILDAVKKSGADAIHPGYGFLSENGDFAQLSRSEGHVFIGPTSENIRTLGNKSLAKQLAHGAGVHLIPGSEKPLESVEEALTLVDKIGGYPVILKAVAGGGGRGMRRINHADELALRFQEAALESEAAFGCKDLYLEKLIEHPRHIEVQIIADQQGQIITALERDCSVQRRHQKIVETAPAAISEATRYQLHENAIKLAKAARYENLGTIEFLVDAQGCSYFLEMNTRIQVEYTVTEMVTGLNLLQIQLLLADGYSLQDLGLDSGVSHNGLWAIQTRLTSEDPSKRFAPSTGTYHAFIPPFGPCLRVESALNPEGGEVTQHFDSMVAKLITWGRSHQQATRRMLQALEETKVSGLTTNIEFLKHVIQTPDFVEQRITTNFIDQEVDPSKLSSQEEQLIQRLQFLGEICVTGLGDPGAVGPPPARISLEFPENLRPKLEGERPFGLRDSLKQKGKTAFLAHILEDKRLWLRDVTPRDAHQSLLATRGRTIDFQKYLQAASYVLPQLFFETHGGATLQTSGLFLKECPYARGDTFRQTAPNLIFETHIRSTNAYAYGPMDQRFLRLLCQELVESEHVDIFRVFEPLNDADKIRIGMDAIKDAGGIIAATPTYSPHLSTHHYLNYARQVVAMGADILDLNDPSGSLKIPAAVSIFRAWRQEFPDLVLRLHMHDRAGMAVPVILALAHEKVGGRYILNVADVACDVLSGGNSLGSMGAVVHTLRDSERDTGVEPEDLDLLNIFLMDLRRLYSCFESSGKTFSSTAAYADLMPGGQNSNLQVQSIATHQPFDRVRDCYIEAADIMGNPPLVTPSSKACGDLALYLSANGLNRTTFREKLSAEQLSSLPNSVISYFHGDFGLPPNGFPPERDVITKLFSHTPMDQAGPFDFVQSTQKLSSQYNRPLSRRDVLWATMLPSAFQSLEDAQKRFGDISTLPTHLLYRRMEVGETVTVEIDQTPRSITLRSISLPDTQAIRTVLFDVDGACYAIAITDPQLQQVAPASRRRKADPNHPGHISAPLSGVLTALKIEVGQTIQKGDILMATEAMKMKNFIQSPIAGQVIEILAQENEMVEENDLLVIIS